MTKYVHRVAALFCTAALAIPPAARSAESSVFVSGSIGRSSIDNGGFDTNDMGYQANAGYRWAVGSNILIGVEGGYAKLGKFSSNPSSTGIDVKERGPIVGANMRVDVAPNWYFGAHTGYMRAHFTASTHFGMSHSETLDAWYAGVGFGHDFNRHVSMGISYDYFDAEARGVPFAPGLIAVSGEYRF